jgi:hypothetical protein
VARATNPESITTTTDYLAKLPPEEPDAGNLHVRVCEGASGQPLALLGVVHMCRRALTALGGDAEVRACQGRCESRMKEPSIM